MSDKAREEFEAWFYNECCHGSGKVNYRSVVTMAAWKAWQASRASLGVNACAGMADPAAEIAELKRQRDELLAVLNKYEEAFDGLFGHCGSNGVFNHWGRRIDCTTLNEAHELSSNATKGPAS